MKRRLSIGILMTVMATILLLGGPGSALAVGDSADYCDRGLFGTVSSVSIAEDGTGTIELEDGEAVAVTPDTTYHLPGILPPWQTWGEMKESGNDEVLKTEARIAVLLDENLEEALKVMIIPQNRVRAHHRGVVTEVNGNTVTVMNRAGNQYTYTFEKGLPEGVEEGKFVTMVVDNRSEGTNRAAVAACNTEQMVLRLQKHIETCDQTQTRERLGELLEEGCGDNVKTLEQIREQARDQVRDQTRTQQNLDQAVEDAEECYQKAQQLREQIRTQKSQ